jgi:hypothetical protein
MRRKRYSRCVVVLVILAGVAGAAEKPQKEEGFVRLFPTDGVP